MRGLEMLKSLGYEKAFYDENVYIMSDNAGNMRSIRISNSYVVVMYKEKKMRKWRKGIMTIEETLACAKIIQEMNEDATNADRIRSMDDEELSLFLEDFKGCARCRHNGNDCFPNFNVAEWLNRKFQNNF